MPDEAVVCPSCGAAAVNAAENTADAPQVQTGSVAENPVVPPPQIYINPEEPTQPPKPMKEKKKGAWVKVIAIVLLAAVLISGVAVLSYFTFLPAKNTLQIARYFTLQKAYKNIDRTMKRQQVMLDALTKGSVASEGEISLSIDPSVLTSMGGADAQTAEWINSELKNMALRYSAASDVPDKKMSFSAGLVYKQNPALSLTGFLDDDKMGFSLPELSPKIITGEFKDLPRLAELFPDQFTESQLEAVAVLNPWMVFDLSDSYLLKADDVKKLLDTYSKALLDSMESGEMSIRRGRKTDVLDKELSCQEITVELDQEAQKDVMVELLDTFKNDDVLYELIFGNLEKIMETIAAENAELSNMSAMMGKGQIKLLINQLKKEIDAEDFPEKVIIKVYIKGLDVVKWVVSVPAGKEGDISISHEQMTVGNKTSSHTIVDMSAPGTAVSIDVAMDNDYDAATDTQDIYTKCNMSVADDSGKSSMDIIFSSKETPDGKGKLAREMDYDVSFDIADSYSGERKTGKIVMAVEGDETRNTDGLYTGGNYTVKLDMTIPDAMPQAFKMGIAFSNTVSYGKEVKLPDLSKAEVLDLKTATQQDFDAYAEEINEKIQMLQLLFGGM